MSTEREFTPSKQESFIWKGAKLFLKVIITVACFWYISGKIDFLKAIHAIGDADWLLLSFSVVVYIISKIIASMRLNLYFKNIGIRLSQVQNLRLYWLGMFYNLFLPGSISGDAYKVVVLTKRFGASYKKTGAAVLLDRFSGLLGLGILLSTYGVLVLNDRLWMGILLSGCFIAVVLFYLITKKFFSDFLPAFWATLFLGLIVQAVQVVGLYCILSALKIFLDKEQWIFIFLTASVVSVLPLSLGGGLGTREVVFAEGATYFGLDVHVGVIISLLFYLSTVAGSLPGMYFIFNRPLGNVPIPFTNKRPPKEP